MSRCMDQECGCGSVSSAVVKALPEEQMKFSHNSTLDMLPHNHNLHLWKKSSPACTLCGENQTLLHVLNNCCSAMNLCRYNDRHDLVLQEIASATKPYLPPTTSMSVDISEGYNFPCHIVPTDMRPDIVWWDSSSRSVCLAELTVLRRTLTMLQTERLSSTQTWSSRQGQMATGQLFSRSKLARGEYPITRVSQHWPESLI
jgi:hypothetical protein